MIDTNTANLTALKYHRCDHRRDHRQWGRCFRLLY